ncbi:MAG TPA: pseudouridine synthase, partial [Elusimicrobiota bacterium]|nr:pseudouridine synthase [Elusimicrobiota bacterium]
MRRQAFVVDAPGLRLDQFLARKLPGYARGHLKDMVERGAVSVDGAARAPDYRVCAGQHVSVRFEDSSWADLPFEKWILGEDADLIALHKPAGILMHPMGESWTAKPEAALADAEANVAGLMIKNRPQALAAGVSRCGLVHRLDRQTSGVVLLAKKPEAQERLQTAFR